MPFQLAGPGVERQNAIGIKIVAGAAAIVAVGPGIARGPVEGVRGRIVRACEPGGTAAVTWFAALPGFDARLAAARHGPTPPDERAGIGGLNAATKPRMPSIGAGDAGDDHVVDDQRGHGAAVVLTLQVGRHGSFPEQFAGRAVEREQVGVVGNEENLIAQNRNAAVGAKSRITDHARSWRAENNARARAGEGVEGNRPG